MKIKKEGRLGEQQSSTSRCPSQLKTGTVEENEHLEKLRDEFSSQPYPRKASLLCTSRGKPSKHTSPAIPRAFPEHSQGIPRRVPASAEVPVPPPAQGATQTLPASTKPGSQGRAQSRPPKHTRGHASFPSKPQLPPGWPELQLLQKILHGICFVSCLVPFSYSGTVREKMLTLLMKENIG